MWTDYNLQIQSTTVLTRSASYLLQKSTLPSCSQGWGLGHQLPWSWNLGGYAVKSRPRRQLVSRIIPHAMKMKTPFKKNCALLRNSNSLALKRLKTIDARMKANPKLSQQHVDFMEAFLELCHMFQTIKLTCRTKAATACPTIPLFLMPASQSSTSYLHLHCGGKI
ncbi:unnamed protein product [Allacma fusca]|uniref:Uncharacterized protein n=1 Tax=Allacma fusca TaxID=39272 RepID=A0A8J2JS94_9HEXA|nr:unnamed protein product [Allacma fusca]